MKQKDILYLSISSFGLIVLWIVFNIYHNVVTSTISEALTVQIAPIKATFDLKTLNALKQRDQIVPIYDGAVATASGIIPTPTPTVQLSTQSALIQNNSTSSAATSGGTLR